VLKYSWVRLYVPIGIFLHIIHANDKEKVNVSDLPGGLYLIQVTSVNISIKALKTQVFWV
jgi:hypothetical protein